MGRENFTFDKGWKRIANEQQSSFTDYSTGVQRRSNGVPDVGQGLELFNDGEWIDVDSYASTDVPVENVGVAVQSLDSEMAVKVSSECNTQRVADNSVPSSTTLALSPTDQCFGTTPWPGWVKSFRDHQITAANEIVEAFETHDDIVFLDAPTGSGKTLIAEMVRRMMDEDSVRSSNEKCRAWYVCNNKALQDQFCSDFPYSSVLKGRSNYSTQLRPFPEFTTADCTKTPGNEPHCQWCENVSQCEYEKAKAAALRSEIGVLNTSYFLTEANGPGKVRGRGLVVCDEADTLESILMGYVEYSVSKRQLERLFLDAPKKGVRKKTILTWMVEQLKPAVYEFLKSLPHESSDVRVQRDKNSFGRLLADTDRVIADLELEIEGETENWIRDNDAGPLVLKPVKVNRYGHLLFNHGEKWLLMSGSLISTQELVDSLGIEELELKSATITVPMTFPVENRQIIVAGLAENSYSNREVAWEKIAEGVAGVLRKHKDDRVLVHTVSYDFANFLMRRLKNNRCVTYGRGVGEKEHALGVYRKKEAAVLLAPSMDRGVDLKEDDCRVVVIAKVPFPSLADKQISARLHSPGGQMWYDVQTIRTLIQMAGRGVRSADDWCVTYVLDSQFNSKILGKCKGLLPKWWRDAITILGPRGIRELTSS